MFPLVVKAQQNAAKMSNNMPQMQVIQQKMTDARLAGNAMQCEFQFLLFESPL